MGQVGKAAGGHMLVSWCTQLKSHCLAGYASYRGQGNVRGTCVHPWTAGRRFTWWATAAGTLFCCGHRQLPAAQNTLLPFTSQVLPGPLAQVAAVASQLVREAARRLT